MYYACLRVGENVLSKDDEHVLKISQLINLYFKENHLIIKFNSYKRADANNLPCVILRGQNDELCPVAALKSLAALRGWAPGPFFIDQDGTPVRRNTLAFHLKTLVGISGLDPTKYNTHSLQIERTTDFAIANVPTSIIKQTGRWKSNVYLKYIRPEAFVLPR